MLKIGTKAQFYQFRKENPTPNHLYFLSVLISFIYLMVSFSINEITSNTILKIVALGLFLTPSITYVTIGEIKEWIGFTGKISHKTGNLPGNKLNVTTRIRYQSVIVLLITILASATEFSYPLIIFISTLLLFMKTINGLKGHYRYELLLSK